MKHTFAFKGRRELPDRLSVRTLLGAGVTGLLVGGLLLYQLAALTGGQAAAVEQETARLAGDWHSILANPLNAPYSALVWLLARLGYDGLTGLRVVSAAFGALSAVLFYLVARQWHSQRVALLASWLFVSSAWFLHTSRLGTAEILWLVSMLAIVLTLLPNRNGRHYRLAFPALLLPLTVTLYVPGMIWLVLAGLIIQRASLREAWEATSSRLLRSLTVSSRLVLLVPLVYGLARAPHLVLRWIGISPMQGGEIPSLSTVAYNLASVPKSLLFVGSFDPSHWLGSLPLLSAFEIVMLLLGIYFYGSHLRAARTRLLFVLAALGWAIVGIAGTTAISLIVPVVYLVATAGIAYILHLWLRVFPTNPLARGVGIGIVSLAILLTSAYQTRSYFVAWRYNQVTQHTFSRQL